MHSSSPLSPSVSLSTSMPAGLTETLEQHSLARTLVLHLLPGGVITLFYFLITPPLLAMGVPNLVSLNLAAILILVPLELGILYAEGKKKNGRFTLEGVVLYRERLPLGWLIGLAFVVLIWVILCFATIAPLVDPWVQRTFFGWLPGWFVLMNGFTSYPREMQLIALVISLVCTSWIAPYVEELYFRGYLLPRISRFGGWAAPLNAFLFSFYHFFTPWQVITRTLAVTPMAWLAQRKRNIYIGIVAHLVLNTLSMLPTIIQVVSK